MNSTEFVNDFPRADLQQADGSEWREAFALVQKGEKYVPTVMEEANYIDPDEGRSVRAYFVIARGATGKSALANYTAQELEAPLWLTNKDFALSAHSLKDHLQNFLRVLDVDAKIQSAQNPLVVIDSVDEAEVRVSTQTWGEFKDSLVEFAEYGLSYVIFGREQALVDIMESFESAGIGFQSLYLGEFAENQRKAFIDVKYQGQSKSGKKSIKDPAYIEARDLLIDDLAAGIPAQSNMMTGFFGYAPVLQVLAEELAGVSNFSLLQKGSAGSRRPVNRLLRIVEQILDREQGKFRENSDLKDSQYAEVYSREEQVRLILREMNFIDEVTIPDCILEEYRQEYGEKRDKQIADHPFLSHTKEEKWANKVFEAYCLAIENDRIMQRHLFYEYAARNPLFSEVLKVIDDGREYDDWTIAALHASSLAYVDGAMHEKSHVDDQRVLGSIQRSEDQKNYVYVSTVKEVDGDLSAHEFRFLPLETDDFIYRGPLQRISIFLTSETVKISTADRAPFMGPGFVVSAKKFHFENREVKLALPRGENVGRVVILTKEVEGMLPRFDIGRAIKDELLPKVIFTGKESEFPNFRRSLNYPWSSSADRLNFSDLFLGVENVFDSPSAKVYRVVEELRVVKNGWSKSREGFLAGVGIPKDSLEAEDLFKILKKHGLIADEHGSIRYVENPETPLFATPFLGASSVSKKLEDLQPEQLSAWRGVFRDLNRMGRKAYK